MNGKKTIDYIDTNADRQQRASTVLKDVHYVIEAHFEMTDKAGDDDTPEKHYNIALRRLRNGKCYHTPYLGCREFPAIFKLVEEIPTTAYKGELDLGYMLYDMEYSNIDDIQPVFFRAILQDGILDLKSIELVR